jgi:hypothetical protein
MEQVVFQHLQNHIEATMAMGENCAPKIAEACRKYHSSFTRWT